MDSLYDVIGRCRLKFAAMADHMDRLDKAVERWLEGKTEVATLLGKANPKRTKYVFTVEDVIPYPAEEWGIILGDAVHCLRSALDQLMWGMCDPGERGERTQFPICFTVRDWVTTAPAQYWGASEGFVKLLDRVQPYQRGDTNAAREHPLALLRSLSNLDKHRTIPAITLVADQTEATSAPTITHKPVHAVFYETAKYTARILDLMVDAWNQAVEATHTEEERVRARLEARRTYP